jgi:hypothetical protein
MGGPCALRSNVSSPLARPASTGRAFASAQELTRVRQVRLFSLQIPCLSHQEVALIEDLVRLVLARRLGRGDLQVDENMDHLDRRTSHCPTHQSTGMRVGVAMLVVWPSKMKSLD